MDTMASDRFTARPSVLNGRSGLNSDYIEPPLEQAMKFSKQVKPISYLKSHAADIAREVAESGEPMLITQNGEARLVVMDVEAYERQEETLALLKILALGKRAIEQGRGLDADDVFAELRRGG